MESPSTVSHFLSKKRVFPGGSSSSSACKDLDVIEIPNPIMIPTPIMSNKQKQVIPHTIIDVDLEEDDDDVVILETGSKEKFMQDAFTSFPVGRSTKRNSSSGRHIQTPPVNVAVDDSGPKMFSDENEWMDFDEAMFDAYESTLSHFDDMFIPPNVETPVPWLPGSSKFGTGLPPAGTSATNSHSQFVSADLGPSSGLNFPTTSSSNSSVAMAAIGIPRRSKRTRVSSHPYSISNKMYQSSSSFQSNVSGGSNHSIPTLMNPSNTHTYLGTYMPPVIGEWPSNTFTPSLTGFMGESAFVSANNDGSLMASAPSVKNVEETIQKFHTFKKFDTVEDYSDHHYSKNSSSAKQQPKNWVKRIQDEWKVLEKDLPPEIFVRVYESRMDLLRAVIVGAEGTPYHDGLFFFDVYFPNTYPNVPPLVHYHSGGLRINPNLYNCGKVCLSLLNTWSGSQKEKWVPKNSTMLQVLVSIQGLILNAKPYFNEPGYANTTGSVQGEKSAFEYNERTFMHSLQTMVYSIRRPPKYFEDYVMGHFCKHGRDILVSCKAYLDGAQVGCLVKGGVQDVDEGDKSCSQQFKNNLAAFITTLVTAFSQTGVKDCDEFRSLAQKGNGPPTTAHHHYF